MHEYVKDIFGAFTRLDAAWNWNTHHWFKIMVPKFTHKSKPICLLNEQNLILHQFWWITINVSPILDLSNWLLLFIFEDWMYVSCMERTNILYGRHVFIYIRILHHWDRESKPFRSLVSIVIDVSEEPGSNAINSIENGSCDVYCISYIVYRISISPYNTNSYTPVRILWPRGAS